MALPTASELRLYVVTGGTLRRLMPINVTDARPARDGAYSVCQGDAKEPGMPARPHRLQ
jgi:hypothetical protein